MEEREVSFESSGKKRCLGERGFTLTELITVIVMICFIAVIPISALQKLRANATQADCANNLKQCHSVLTLYAQDYDGIIPLHGNPYPGYWAGRCAGYFKDKSRDIAVCPCAPPYTFKLPHLTYGIRLDGPSGCIIKIPQLRCPGYFLRMNKIEKASVYHLLADTSSPDERGIGQIGAFCTKGWFGGNCGIRLRHSNCANIMFADGHVESCGKSRLEMLGITHYIEEDGTIHK